MRPVTPPNSSPKKTSTGSPPTPVPPYRCFVRAVSSQPLLFTPVVFERCRIRQRAPADRLERRERPAETRYEPRVAQTPQSPLLLAEGTTNKKANKKGRSFRAGAPHQSWPLPP